MNFPGNQALHGNWTPFNRFMSHLDNNLQQLGMNTPGNQAQSADSTQAKCEFQAKPTPQEIYDDLRIVTVEVVEEGQTENFPVYRNLLCYHSGYYDRLLNGRFKEAGTDVIRITDTSIPTFKAVFMWLNIGMLPKSIEYRTIFEVYVFADRHIMPRLKNAAVEACLDNIVNRQTLPNYVFIRYLYKNTAPGDLMRKLLVDLHIYRNPIQRREFSKYDRDFLAEAMEEFMKEKIEAHRNGRPVDFAATPAGFKRRLCDYHDHREAHVTDAQGSNNNTAMEPQGFTDTQPVL